MWLIFARAPRPDVQVWSGRRALALLDALAWPAAWIAGAMTIGPAGGAVGHLLIAVCLVAAFQRGHRALAHNARYHFTTWRWGRVLVMILAIGYALKLAILVSG